MTDRDYLKRALSMMILWKCGRYCLCTYRCESAEKADIHWDISAIIASLIWGDKTDIVTRMNCAYDGMQGKTEIHEYLADNLTDNMDVVIGMPIGEYQNNNYFDSKKYGAKMFDWIWEHFDEMCKLEKDI